jgi:hypothetical protein
MNLINHDSLIGSSVKYKRLNEMGMAFINVYPEDKIVINLKNPNECFSVAFGIISSIWPILDPKFKSDIKISSIEFLRKEIKEDFQIDVFSHSGKMLVNYSLESNSIKNVIESALDFYIDLMLNKLLTIQIKKIESFSRVWNPYNGEDVHIVLELTEVLKSNILNFFTGSNLLEDISSETYWTREILVRVKNSKKYISETLIEKAKNKYIELEVITSIL